MKIMSKLDAYKGTKSLEAFPNKHHLILIIVAVMTLWTLFIVGAHFILTPNSQKSSTAESPVPTVTVSGSAGYGIGETYTVSGSAGYPLGDKPGTVVGGSESSFDAGEYIKDLKEVAERYTVSGSSGLTPETSEPPHAPVIAPQPAPAPQPKAVEVPTADNAVVLERPTAPQPAPVAPAKTVSVETAKPAPAPTYETAGSGGVLEVTEPPLPVLPEPVRETVTPPLPVLPEPPTHTVTPPLPVLPEPPSISLPEPPAEELPDGVTMPGFDEFETTTAICPEGINALEDPTNGHCVISIAKGIETDTKFPASGTLTRWFCPVGISPLSDPLNASCGVSVLNAVKVGE